MNSQQRKIYIFVDGQYKATTTWSQTCKGAIAAFKAAHPNTRGKITASFTW